MRRCSGQAPAPSAREGSPTFLDVDLGVGGPQLTAWSSPGRQTTTHPPCEYWGARRQRYSGDVQYPRHVTNERPGVSEVSDPRANASRSLQRPENTAVHLGVEWLGDGMPRRRQVRWTRPTTW